MTRTHDRTHDPTCTRETSAPGRPASDDPRAACRTGDDPGAACRTSDDPGAACPTRDDPGAACPTSDDPGAACPTRDDPGAACPTREDARVAQEAFLTELAKALSSRTRRQGRIPGFRPAAVLVPLVCREDALHVTFLKRVEDGSIHSGQVAFPGGGREVGDEDQQANALREAEEEVGIPASSVRLLGALDDSATISRYIVTPVVGVLEPSPEYRLDPREVQEVFEVPLAYLLDPVNERKVDDVELLGRRWPLYEYRWEEKLIWGATGRILFELLDLARVLPSTRTLVRAASTLRRPTGPSEEP